MIIDVLLWFSHSTGIYEFMNSAWGWPIAESVHFLGMCLLIGTVGVFDLRMLGVGSGIPMAELHKLVPIGVFGFLLNFTSGVMFLTSAPDQYLYNPAFQTKILFMLLAGLNMMVFYRRAMAEVKTTNSLLKAPANARVMAMVSLGCWATVIIGGRLITYYRPPYHWCWWCL